MIQHRRRRRRRHHHHHYHHHQASAKTLGYDEALWNGNGQIPIENKDWEELSDEQKKAAEVLGFDEDEWDDSDDEGPRYEDVDWKHLLPDVKAAAIELGYTEEMWDSESSDKKLDIEDKDWDELTQKERDLLKIIGYNEDLVSACLVLRLEYENVGRCNSNPIEPLLSQVEGAPVPVVDATPLALISPFLLSVLTLNTNSGMTKFVFCSFE